MSEPTFDYDAKLAELKTEFHRRFEDKSPFKKEQLKNFKFSKVLGEGAFGIVKLAKHQPTNDVAAVKILKKTTIVSRKQLSYITNERKVLAALNYELVISLKFTMQDNSFIYMGMAFINGGELYTILRKFGKFEEPSGRFYASQVVLGLEYIHHMGLVYRDLKPENILMDRNGYLKITDFGFAKLLREDAPRTYSMCGTPEYIAPEIVMRAGYGRAVDWWAFGVLVFELNAGYSPFYVDDQMRMMERICDGKFKYPSQFGAELRDLIANLLQVDLSRRFGNLKNGISDIKRHKWFEGINWNSVYLQQMTAPYVPTVSDDGDPSQFDQYDDVVLRVSEHNKHEEQFADF